jgi:hypothetical protein
MGKILTANTDATLWFNVESEKGVNTFEVKTKDGNVYTRQTLDWDKEIKDRHLGIHGTGKESDPGLKTPM